MTSKKYPMGYNPIVLEEIYTKENRIRTNWFYKNWDLLTGLTETGRKSSDDADLRRKEMLRSQLKQMRSSKRFIKLGGTPLAIRPEDPNICLDIMRPVDPSVTQIIYEKSMELLKFPIGDIQTGITSKTPVRQEISEPACEILRFGIGRLYLAQGIDISEISKITSPSTKGEENREPSWTFDLDWSYVIHHSYIPLGGEEYLEKRVLSAPDHRYYLPEATSFDYGWTSDALQHRVYRPPFGRSTEAMRSLYRRQNVRPDSDNVRLPYRSGPLEFDNL